MKVAEGISRMICAGCLLASTAWAQSRPSTPITLTVTTTSHGYEIPIDFSGLSFERGTLNTNNAGASGYLFSTTNTQLTTLFQNLGIHSLRVGGGSVDTMVPVGYNPDGNRGIDSLFDFAQAAGAKVIYTVRMLNTKNTLPNLKADDAVIDKYIWNNYRANVSNFAIGNEPDFRNPYHTAGDPAIFETTPGATATAYPSYLVDWRNFASTILGSGPGQHSRGRTQALIMTQPTNPGRNVLPMMKRARGSSRTLPSTITSAQAQGLQPPSKPLIICCRRPGSTILR